MRGANVASWTQTLSVGLPEEHQSSDKSYNTHGLIHEGNVMWLTKAWAVRLIEMNILTWVVSQMNTTGRAVCHVLQRLIPPFPPPFITTGASWNLKLRNWTMTVENVSAAFIFVRGLRNEKLIKCSHSFLVLSQARQNKHTASVNCKKQQLSVSYHGHI